MPAPPQAVASSSAFRARRLASALALSVALAPGCNGAGATREAPVVSAAARADFSSRPDAVRFAVIGDSGQGTKEQYELAGQMLAHRERVQFDFVIMLGDNVYDGNAPEDYREKFERPYRPLLDAGVTFHAARGNHDVGEGWLYPHFNTGGHRYFTFRKTGGPLGLLTRNTVQFFAIDSVTFDADQRAWLERELRSSDASWKICFMHQPLYTSGRYWWSAMRWRRQMEAILVNHGVDVVFSGHEHLYERLVPQQGVVYFTSGAAGSVRRGDLRESSYGAAGYDDDLHFMLVEIAGDTLRFEAVSRTGAVVDAGEIRRPSRRGPAGVRRPNPGEGAEQP